MPEPTPVMSTDSLNGRDVITVAVPGVVLVGIASQFSLNLALDEN